MLRKSNITFRSVKKPWTYATAIANINTGENYTIKQVKQMERKKLIIFTNFR